jgi:hypothetical protein
MHKTQGLCVHHLEYHGHDSKICAYTTLSIMHIAASCVCTLPWVSCTWEQDLYVHYLEYNAQDSKICVCVHYLEYQAHDSKICVYITISIMHMTARCVYITLSITHDSKICVHYRHIMHMTARCVYITLSITHMIARSVCTLAWVSSTW